MHTYRFIDRGTRHSSFDFTLCTLRFLCLVVRSDAHEPLDPINYLQLKAIHYSALFVLPQTLVPSGAARRCLGHSHSRSGGGARVGVWGVCLSFYQSSHAVFPALFPAFVFLEVTSSPLGFPSFPMVSLILLFDLSPCSYVCLCFFLSFSNDLGALNFWTFRVNFHLLIAHPSSATFLVVSGSHFCVLHNVYFWTVGCIFLFLLFKLV